MRSITPGLVALGMVFFGAHASAQDQSLLERGTYLMTSIVACGNCHTPKRPDGRFVDGMELAGSFTIEEPIFRAYSPNITPDVETGIGRWTDKEIIRAIREGIRPDGSIIGPPMPVLFYRNMSDRDVTALVAYLRTVKPVANVVPKSTYNIPLPPNWGPPVETVADVSRDHPAAYGYYVTNTLGHCMECHTPLSETGQLIWDREGEGGRVFENIFGLGVNTISSNVSSHKLAGIGAWSDKEVIKAFTEGVSRDGRKLAPAMAFANYENITEEDRDAIVSYLRTLKPQPAE